MATPARRALYGKLAGDTTLNGLLGTPAAGYAKAIYHSTAPAGAAFPLVILAKQSGRPTETFSDPSAFETDTWLIKAVDRSTSADPAEAIAARVGVLLNDAVLSISGGVMMYLRRQSDVEYPEIEDGVTYQHVGSLYRFVFS